LTLPSLFLDAADVIRLREQLRDVTAELDSEREAKLSLENKHQALTDDHQLLAK